MFSPRDITSVSLTSVAHFSGALENIPVALSNVSRAYLLPSFTGLPLRVGLVAVAVRIGFGFCSCLDALLLAQAKGWDVEALVGRNPLLSEK